MYYPRSFLKFILLGFLLVSLPLIYALAELILSLDRLQSQAQQAVTQAAEAGRASRQSYEHSVTLERIATASAPGNHLHELATRAVEAFREREGIALADGRAHARPPRLRIAGIAI